ncbi:hypothetical protein E6C50_00775 [Flavobacterium supellecticarium]|uniref:Lipocalin-like domain-containing protein n=1 Tax=Flavobacterium supellecticarium TaxID=2565924 RepID=A0A4S4A3C2_9FLAO|nr:hypothetical protein [Flavobacterium supellecticarium]THF52778.1 hypothetical protein E6C50_00775 [Flavobacterium supellecticarium]
MNYLLLLLLLTLFSHTTQEQQNPLVNTRWEYTVAEDCISYITFKADGTYENYNCEMNYPYSGKYEIKKNTITLIEIDLLSNVPSVNEENNYKTGIIRRNKFVNNGKSLQYISWENYDHENNKWSGDIIFPPNEIFYIKVTQ